MKRTVVELPSGTRIIINEKSDKYLVKIFNDVITKMEKESNKREKN
jgi:hypothetical protein